jgi:hypothetical protein
MDLRPLAPLGPVVAGPPAALGGRQDRAAGGEADHGAEVDDGREAASGGSTGRPSARGGNSWANSTRSGNRGYGMAAIGRPRTTLRGFAAAPQIVHQRPYSFRVDLQSLAPGHRREATVSVGSAGSHPAAARGTACSGARPRSRTASESNNHPLGY